MKALRSSLLFSLLIFLSCTPDSVEQDPDVENPDTRPTLEIPDGFDFNTYKNVSVTINDNLENSIYKVYSEIRKADGEVNPEELSYDEILLDGQIFKLNFTGVTVNGVLNNSLNLPSYCEKIFIRRKSSTGFTDNLLNIANNSVSLSYGQKPSSPSHTKSSTTINGTLTSDVFVEGDAVVQGFLNGNGWDLIVTGNLNVSGGANLNGTTVVEAENINISGFVNLNGGSIYSSSINVSGGINGPGFVYYCSTANVSGNINNNQPQSVLQEECSDDSDGDGVSDVDDAFPNDPNKSFLLYSPSPTGYAMLTFEDLWPSFGDYDFNDVSLRYRTEISVNSNNEAVQIDFVSKVVANGAGFINGFGIELEGVPSSAIESVTGPVYTENYISNNANGTESGQQDAVIIFTDNQDNLLEETTISVKFNQPISTNVLGTAPFNPFIIKNMVRENEIHLPFFDVTDLGNLNPEFEGANRDEDGDFISTDGYPWALSFPEEIALPNETVRIDEAYNFFSQWATSGGNDNQDWYVDLPGNIDSGNVQQ